MTVFESKHTCKVSETDAVSVTGVEEFFERFTQFSEAYYTELTKNTDFMNNPLRLPEIASDVCGVEQTVFREVLDTKTINYLQALMLEDVPSSIAENYYLYVYSNHTDTAHSTKEAPNQYSIGPLHTTVSDILANEAVEILAIDVEKSAKTGELWIVFGNESEDRFKPPRERGDFAKIKKQFLSEVLNGTTDRDFASIYLNGTQTLLVALGFYPAQTIPLPEVIPEETAYPIDLVEIDRTDSTVLYNTELVTEKEVIQQYKERHPHREQGEFHMYPEFAIEYFTNDDSISGHAGGIDSDLAYIAGEISKEELQALKLTPFSIGKPYLEEAIEYALPQRDVVMSTCADQNVDPLWKSFSDRDEITTEITKSDIVFDFSNYL